MIRKRQQTSSNSGLVQLDISYAQAPHTTKHRLECVPISARYTKVREFMRTFPPSREKSDYFKYN